MPSLTTTGPVLLSTGLRPGPVQSLAPYASGPVVVAVPGPPGSAIRAGSGAPVDDGIMPGDLWVDTDTGDLWEWSTAWALVGSILGPQGPTGATGPQGDAGPGDVLDPGFAVTVASVTGTYSIPVTVPGARLTMTAGTAFSFDTPTQAGMSLLVHLAGAFVPTWPASVKWHSGVAPVYAGPSLYSFTTLDGGTTWIGAQVGRAIA